MKIIEQGILSALHNSQPPYPGLRYFNQTGMEGWEDSLSFTARFDSVRVRDRFTIRIELHTDPLRFPKVKEIGGRTDKILAKWKARGKAQRLADLHVNPDRLICFCPAPEEKRKCAEGIKLESFISEQVIPYFFALHEFEKAGKWIWGAYCHGDYGILEYYLDHRNDNDATLLDDCLTSLKSDPTNVQLNGKEKCFCGSGLKLKKCHPKVFQGYRAIVEDLKLRRQK